MPGLIVVAADPRAEERVRRAAQPLLRWPWEGFSVAAAGDGTVALGFAGERGGLARDDAAGCVVAFEGELYGPPRVRTGIEPARELLSLYLRDGARIEPPEGSFAAAIWDGRKDALVLITDRFGSRPLYAAREGNTMLAAGELKSIVAAGFAARLDPQGVAEQAVYGWWFTDRTLLAGVRLLPAAATYVLDREGERETRRWRYRPDGGEPLRLDERELAEEFGRLLDRAVSTMLDGTKHLALSGGLDSRCVAAVLSDRGFAGLAATHGTRGSKELRLAARAARGAGLAHRVLPLERGHMARGAATCVWLSDGRKVALSTHGLSFRALRLEEGARAILTGSRGDGVARMEAVTRADSDAWPFARTIHEHVAHGIDRRLAEALQPQFASELEGRAEAALAETLASGEGDLLALHAELYFRDTAIPGTALFDDHLTPRTPYAEPALVDFCSSLPYDLRLGGRLQRAFLRRYPALARVPTWNERLSPALPRRLERPARLAVRVRRRVSARANVYLPAAWRRFPFLYFEDVMLAGADILLLLLEERTIARGQVREEVVRRLVSETLHGQAAHVSLLGRLVRLELFQRQFVDGDGAPPVID